jgi:hypothetical protein
VPQARIAPTVLVHRILIRLHGWPVPYFGRPHASRSAGGGPPASAPIYDRTMVADVEAAAEAAGNFVELLQKHREVRQASRSGPRNRHLYASLDEEIMQRLPQISAIASSVSPGLTDLIYGRVRTDPYDWKYEDILQAALVLKGTLDNLAETQRIVGHGVGSNPRSTMEQRSSYARQLRNVGAVDSESEATSDEMALHMGLPTEVIYDIETFLYGAGLIEYVRLATVCLTDAGRRWVDQNDASLDTPPPGSRTVTVVVGAGAQVGAIQAGSDSSTQSTRVEVDSVRAVSGWVNEVCNWLNEISGVIDAETLGKFAARIEDIEEQLADENPDHGWLKRQVRKVQTMIEETSVSMAGSLAAEGLIAAGPHLISLL